MEIKKTRQCGECKECCYVAVVEFRDKEIKPALTFCKYICEKGCSIHREGIRPQVCSAFFCPWARGFGEEEDRPDKNGVFIDFPDEFNGGRWMIVMDLKKNAHKTTGKRIILEVADRVNLPVIVVDFDNLKYGKGDYVIIKDSLQHRSSKIKGEFIGDFGHMKEYRLEIS